MKQIDQIKQVADRLQRRNKFLSLPLAVLKKYGEDESGYQAALLAYYGFLSLFPLLIVMTTVLQIVLGSYPDLHQKAISAFNENFPIIGQHLQKNVGTMGKSGLTLVVSLLFTVYGARGVADAFRHAVNHVWETPHQERSSFPIAAARSLAIIVGGGLLFILASVASSFAFAHGRVFWERIGALVLAFIVLVLAFMLAIKLSLPHKESLKKLRVGTYTAAVGFLILQAAGGYVVTHQLKHLNSLYGTFALVLGLFFWMYLQAQVVLYALEIQTVVQFGLWPRALDADNPTKEDIKAYKLYAKRNRYVEYEEVEPTFRAEKKKS